MSLSRYAEDKFIDALRGTAFSVASLWVALYSSVPGDTGSGTEISNSGYARVGFPHFATASGGYTESNTACVFPQAGESWGTVNGLGIFDAETGGNRISQASLSYPLEVNSGDTASFAAGDISVSLD